MKSKLKFLLCWLITSIILTMIPQIALAFTYPNPRRTTNSGDSSWILIPIAVIVVGFVVMIYFQRRKASKEAAKGTQADIKVSSVVQAKLLPNEKPIRQLNIGRSDFVATDKRLLRFSAGGFQSMEYTNISGISYKTSPGKKLAARIVIGLCMILLIWITIFIWISVFDHSVSNVDVMDAIIITVVTVGIGIIGVMGASRDFGFYQVESKAIDQGALKSWQITRPPLYFGNINVDEFVKTVKEHIKT